MSKESLVAKAENCRSSANYKCCVDNTIAALAIDAKFTAAYILKAICLKENGQADDALATENMCLAQVPNDYGCIIQKTQDLRDHFNDFQAAALTIRDLALSSSNYEPFDIYASALQRKWDPDNAILQLDSAIEKFPFFRNLYWRKADILFYQLYKLPEAEATFQKIFPNNKIGFQKYLSLANIQRAQGKIDAAIQTLNEGMKNYGSSIREFHEYLGHYLRDYKGKFSDSANSFDNAIKFNPGWWNYLSKADSLRRAGKPLEAVDVLNEALRKFPLNLELYEQKADVLNDLGRFSEAANTRLSIPESWSNMWYLIDRVALCYLLGDSLEKALEKENEAINQWPHIFYELYLNKGKILMKLLRYEEAAVTLQEAIDLRPDMVSLYKMKAQCLRYAGKYDQVLHLYNEMIDRFPLFVDIIYEKSQTLLEIGSYDQVISYMEGMSTNKFDYDILKLRALSENGKYDDCSSFAAILSGKYVNCQDCLYNVRNLNSKCLYEQNKKDEAFIELDKNISLFPQRVAAKLIKSELKKREILENNQGCPLNQTCYDNNTYEVFEIGKFNVYDPKKYEIYDKQKQAVYDIDNFAVYNKSKYDVYEPSKFGIYNYEMFDVYNKNKYEVYEPNKFRIYDYEMFDVYNKNKYEVYDPKKYKLVDLNLETFDSKEYSLISKDKSSYDSYDPEKYKIYDPNEYFLVLKNKTFSDSDARISYANTSNMTNVTNFVKNEYSTSMIDDHKIDMIFGISLFIMVLLIIFLCGGIFLFLKKKREKNKDIKDIKDIKGLPRDRNEDLLPDAYAA